MPRLRLRFVLAIGLLTVAGCRHRIPAPYARGQGPAPAELLDRTGAQLSALQVSKAKVIANRTLRGNLAFIAEAPGRFRGTVDVAGNELVTLAFHEDGYALRYKLDAFPAGFYAGPPSACAVEALLGISFETEGLVDLVLGGAPVIEAPFEILDQKWEPRGGYEKLTIANGRFVQELRFGWVGNAWRVVGGQLFERQGNTTGRRLWTVEHIELAPEGADGSYLPDRTKVSTPGRRRDNTVVINYKERDPDPAFARGRAPTKTDTDEPDVDPKEDPWEEGDPWEEDGGWENEDESAGTAEAGQSTGTAEPGAGEAGTQSDNSAGDTATGSDNSAGEAVAGETVTEGESGEVAREPSGPAKKSEPSTPSAPAKVVVPPEFQLEPTGLTPRGDLCR